MAVELTIESAASADAVLAAIAGALGTERRPPIPPALRQAGLLRLDASAHGPGFRVRCVCRPQDLGAPVLRGRVESGAGGGVRVRARIEIPPAPKAVAAVLGAVGLAMLAARQWSGMALVGLAGATLLGARPRGTDVAGHPLTPLLADWLAAAVAAADAGGGAAIDFRAPAPYLRPVPQRPQPSPEPTEWKTS